jgi:hypothetical protein
VNATLDGTSYVYQSDTGIGPLGYNHAASMTLLFQEWGNVWHLTVTALSGAIGPHATFQLQAGKVAVSTGDVTMGAIVMVAPLHIISDQGEFDIDLPLSTDATVGMSSGWRLNSITGLSVIGSATSTIVPAIGRGDNLELELVGTPSAWPGR